MPLGASRRATWCRWAAALVLQLGAQAPVAWLILKMGVLHGLFPGWNLRLGPPCRSRAPAPAIDLCLLCAACLLCSLGDELPLPCFDTILLSTRPFHPAALLLHLSLTPQVLKDVGMDASQADELMAAASGAPSSAGTTPRGDGGTGASGGGTAGSSAAGSGAADGGSAADSSAASSRTISFEDFRRLLLSTPPSIITKVNREGAWRELGRQGTSRWPGPGHGGTHFEPAG